jgi:hypothetical protein
MSKIQINWNEVDGYRLWATDVPRLGGVMIETHRALNPYGMVDGSHERFAQSDAARGAFIGQKSPKWRLWSTPFGLRKGMEPNEFDTEEDAIQALDRELGLSSDYMDILLLSPRQ